MGESMQKVINEKICYIPCSENPLSADIGMIRENGETWLFDVGEGMENIASLLDTGEKYHVVLSHFHQDHMGNIGRIPAVEIYASKETFKHAKAASDNASDTGIMRRDATENDTTWHIVDRERNIGNLHIFPLASSHAKGCVGLEIDETYAFVGDALYCKVRDGYLVFNAQHLQEEIKVLKGLKAPYLLVSHHPGLIRGREECIAELEEIYQKRVKNEPEIRLKT